MLRQFIFCGVLFLSLMVHAYARTTGFQLLGVDAGLNITAGFTSQTNLDEGIPINPTGGLYFDHHFTQVVGIFSGLYFQKISIGPRDAIYQARDTAMSGPVGLSLNFETPDAPGALNIFVLGFKPNYSLSHAYVVSGVDQTGSRFKSFTWDLFLMGRLLFPIDNEKKKFLGLVVNVMLTLPDWFDIGATSPENVVPISTGFLLSYGWDLGS